VWTGRGPRRVCTAWAGAATVACTLSMTGTSGAAPGEPAAPAAPTEEATDTPEGTPPAQPPAESSTVAARPDRDTDDDEPAHLAPPPAAPHAADQYPRPYLQRPPAPSPLRGLELGADLGVTQRSADGTTADYQPGPTYGGYAVLPLVSWRRSPELGRFLLGMRIRAGGETHSVSVKSDLGVPGGEFVQPDLSGLHLGVRLEPGYQITPWLAAFVGIGVAWARFEAPPLQAQVNITAATRTGTLVEFPFALGASVEIVPGWVNVNLAGWVSVVADNEGSLFESGQAIDPNGMPAALQALPEFGTSFAGRLSLGVIL